MPNPTWKETTRYDGVTNHNVVVASDLHLGEVKISVHRRAHALDDDVWYMSVFGLVRADEERLKAVSLEQAKLEALDDLHTVLAAFMVKLRKAAPWIP